MVLICNNTLEGDERARNNTYHYMNSSGNALQWRKNVRHGFSNHQPHDCLFNRLFRRRSKKTSKLRVIGFFAGNSTMNSPRKGPVTQKNVSIWWCHHGKLLKVNFHCPTEDILSYVSKYPLIILELKQSYCWRMMSILRGLGGSSL